MFSIAAINDTDAKSQWEPLAPTKEAQEFHLTQTYHEGLLKLQAKEYDKARQLLESVLKDPLIASSEVDGEAGDSHLLQLRFLALKNLAGVFLQQGSSHYESALRCYLQAVEIDIKDTVVWNQLGTLSCSMGLLSISRWAFEQGLSCSPNNWNCMEKLLEVLIAIGDEVACLSVAELILRHWPSHARALYVKNTIEESEPVPYAPRGIDKLKPKHVRLKFLDKRKETDDNLDEGAALKKLKQTVDIHLAEASWAAIVDALLDILLPLSGCCAKMEVGKARRSGDVPLRICLSPCSENVMGGIGLTSTSICESVSGDCNTGRVSIIREKEANVLEEHQERRSTRLERLRSRKPGKEGLDFDTGKDLAKVVSQYLEPFLAHESGKKDMTHHASCSITCPDQDNSWVTEPSDVSIFLRETSSNYGAYHMGHLLLEKLASTHFSHQEASVKFLELEKLTRHWGKDRTPECCLFLAEIYFDVGSSFCDASKLSEFMSEASYHLCKIIEVVALENHFPLISDMGNGSFSQSMESQGSSEIWAKNSVRQDSLLDKLLLTNNSSFWVRFFWLSGQVSIWEGKKGKAYEELCISLSLLAKKIDMDKSVSSVCVSHCGIVKRLTIDRLVHDINILKVNYLMEKTVPEMIEKEMYVECITLLSPLLFSTEDVHLDALSLQFAEQRGEGFTSAEISALDTLLKSCEKTNPINIEVYLNSHRRKLHILMAAAGMDEYFSCKSVHQKSGDIESKESSKESSNKHWNHLVAEEVKAISQCVSQVKIFRDHSTDSNGIINQAGSIGDMQFLLLSVMCNVASIFLSRKNSGSLIIDQTEGCCFVDGAIAFCKLQHLNLCVPPTTQVELIVAMHDLLAEYGLCCWGEGGEGEEGKFLKFAIKHLLALDMKLKSSEERTQCEEMQLHNSHSKTSADESILDTLPVEISQNETRAAGKDVFEGITSNDNSSDKALELNIAGVGCLMQVNHKADGEFVTGEKASSQLTERENEQNEDEKEELESRIENALDQCFYCLYGLNVRGDSSYEDDLSVHKNSSRGDYQTKEQCADVFLYILPYAKASSRTGLVKLRRVLRAIRKHFPQPPEDILDGNAIDKFLDDSNLCEDKLSEEAGSVGFLETMKKMLLNDAGSIKQYKSSVVGGSEPYLDVYSNLYYFLALSEEMSATDKWTGFVLTKEGEEFVQNNASLFKYDLLYNPLRFESWQKLANIYDEEVDLLLNDGSKHINVGGWRKNDTLPQRVEMSRRRSRRCLLMSLALAKSSSLQGEIHELLALVYYDSLQNVVPFYDQRSVVPSKDAAWITFCENSMKHFNKAFAHKQDWSQAFYMGKLSEKLGYSHEIAFSYYAKAMTLNQSAVDPVYRLHASRLKLLYKCGKQNVQALKIISAYAFSQSVGDTVVQILNEMSPGNSHLPAHSEAGKHDECQKVEEMWNILYKDCLSALESCVEGDLKHFHKARYILAQGLYKRGESGYLEKAKDELSFCFKSSRSSFTINMWEIDSMVKKGRRKTPGLAGNKKTLEVNLAESSRKFITCIRKYLLFYLKLMEETGDIYTLERAYISLRADKRFALCIEDLVPVALGRYIKALISPIRQGELLSSSASSSEQVLEKIFSLFIEQGNLWPEICSLSELGPGISEITLYGYLHEHLISLEGNVKLENLEAINEKIRKRFKNLKSSNSNCATVCKHASIAWCRSLIISLALITPLKSGTSQCVLENNQLLCVDLQTNELWSSSFEDSTHMKSLETEWTPTLSKINKVFVKKATDENSDAAHSLLRSSFNFYRDSSYVMLPSGVNLYLVPHRLAMGTNFHPSMDGVEILDLSIPRKLLLWSYTLVHGHCPTISAVVKHCEENLKSKMKKGAGNSTSVGHTSLSGVGSSHTAVAGLGKDGTNHGGTDVEAAPLITVISASMLETTNSANTLRSWDETHKDLSSAPQLHHCNNNIAERSTIIHGGGDLDIG